MSMETPASYFVDFNKLIPKLLWGGKAPRIANTAPKESKVGGLALPNLKAYCEAAMINTGWYWGENRQTDQRNLPESLERDPHKCN